MGVLTGPRVISMSSAELGTKESSTPEAVAAFGADAVVFQRVLLRFARRHLRRSDHAHGRDPRQGNPSPTFVAAVLSVDTIAAPLNLGSLLQLSFDPFNAPFAIAMTDFGSVKQIAGSRRRS